jgi:hypothetical protein
MEQRELLKTFLIIILLGGFVILLTLSVKSGCTHTKNITEGWLNYVSIPFGRVTTPYDHPIALYPRPEYRLPYNWPVGVKTEFPIPHIAPLMSGVL